MHPVLAAFPRRPLRILRTGVPSVLGLGLLGVLMLAFVAGIAVWMGPGILHDWEIRGNPVEVPQARISNGKCRSKLVLVSCEADLAYAVDGKRYGRHVSFSFVDVHFGDYTANVVRSADKPELATLDIGLEAMWNRIATAVGGIALFLAIGIGLFRNAGRSAGLKKIARRSDQLTPVTVTVTQMTKSWLGKNVSCTYAAVGAKPRKFAERMKKKEDPFFLDGRTALAVVPGSSPTPILVDEALTRIDLNDAERHALLAARHGAMPPPAAAWPQPQAR